MTELKADELPLTEPDDAGRLWHRVKTRWELVALLGILVVGIPAITWLPEKMVQRVYRGDRSRESGNEYAKLVDDYRKTLVQIIGGAFLLYTLYLTQRRTKAAEETLRTTHRSLELTRKSLEVTRETQITDRFTKAVAQLGATDSQGKKQLEIRFGGIYALERIAKDSPDDHWPIMEILTAYVRQNAPWREPANPQEATNKVDEEIPELEKDIQAVLTVIGRRKRESDKGRLDLSNVDLRRADVREAHLEEAKLWGAHLEKADLWGAHLEEAWLLQPQIDGAIGNHETKLPLGLTYPEHWLWERRSNSWAASIDEQ
ncbi:MAG TPA: pentapeptide repeat-containing protein [Bryobacteraceae bacterium]|jgi:hypothetical protein|nr:pentapeptide repeat-containing protein [Bryobacteraceae bacterium]